ncbi:hypothetical protein SeMB42_g00724 [Synchytrium endobioticum]|uniref:Cilia- and flagella-associated protein 299 n=1 Tax=Synchytrium endobioticum TaxID=286115 RepID=A0A507D4L7_9FUNG|nr:hypothetical protein SeLEV6574_g03271 [Synchytrium endobioticum]TPX53540.1 hypothetical protein SeMB42_g00724 [Synchytrium endobioticum]
MADDAGEATPGASPDTVLSDFATYEDYLDAQITATDLYYLEDRELARQLVELGYRAAGEPLRRDEFDARQRAAEGARMAKRMHAKELASHSAAGASGSALMQALAEREADNRNGKLTTIVFIRTRNARNQEISGYIDYATRLKAEPWEPYFQLTRPLLPRPTDLSFYNWETSVATSSSTPNFQVVADQGKGLLFKNKRDRKIVNVNPQEKPGDNTTRTAITTKEHIQVVIYDHLTRRKS